MIADPGSSCNILPEATFRKMPGLKLRSCNSRVYAYASRSPLEVMGSCEVRMSMQGGGLTKAPIMAYYRIDADTRIVTDGSPLGLGAVLQQKQEDGQYKPVYYA
ncbi:hypothetical protein LSAT2_027359, partial [Lamellibrachia satsuma]